ncbi:MAG: nucleotidyltransferase domain-containing protein, partial [Pollutimonas bauzanensis]
VTRELARLADVGLLLREKRGNQQLYRADTACPIVTELASILRKTSGIADVLAAALAPLASQLRIGFIFGSVAQGRESTGSDIDLMLIGDMNFNDAVHLTWPLQTQLGREINPKVFSASEFKARATEPFLRDVLNKPKIFLTGDEHELAELAGYQP